MFSETAWVTTTEASRLLGRSASFLKRQRESHGGFLESGTHYALAPSSNAPITWNVPLIRDELSLLSWVEVLSDEERRSNTQEQQRTHSDGIKGLVLGLSVVATDPTALLYRRLSRCLFLGI